MVCVTLALNGCSQPTTAVAKQPQQASTSASEPDRTASPKPPAQRGPAAWQADLLTKSMQVASSLETKAHARVKARLQKDVASTAIEIGLIDVGIRDAEAIQDWRRGQALAIAAQALARKGDRASAEACVAKAVQVAASTESAKQDQLNLEIALAMAMLGNVEQARQYGARAPVEFTGRVEAQLVSQVSIDEVDRQCDAFDKAIASGSFDIVRSGVDGYFRVWSRVRTDATRGGREGHPRRAASPAAGPADRRAPAACRRTR
ncbi:MAG: hypothetical protein EBR71_01370 [Planctomycetes bacterium]|nr:hypothetical protein [Planctomycetota bacterium]